MKKKVYQKAIELTNGPVTSGVLRRFAQSAKSRWVIPGYIKTYNITLDDIDSPLDSFSSLHDFFIRKLKAASRPTASAPIVSPVDGTIEALGDLHEGIEFLVKNQQYSLAALLGSDQMAEQYQNGKYAVFYLSPADYHRIHSPVNGTVLKQYLAGKKSYPVNRYGLLYGKTPLSGNYRMVTELETDFGRLLVVKVGAMFINSIELTNRGKEWKKGEEVGYFSFGSTVVLFFQENQVELLDDIAAGRQVKMGEAVANMI
ncbi:phosphatidylserine decarboxylase [Planococcus salinus]|uniref:Phosphatidylserine decarboxylase proenzyme n=1 Tax=Planococcus salinus TaxID=1848460 RepID=A0A3M8PB95_9BACL|nr:phosphatidylserine decarboxylase [Planococcus salinus]RNF40989.1 phosphatidylserine decarboxylase [Planococcus salinus]